MKKQTQKIMIENATTRGQACQCLPISAGIVAPRAAAAMVVGFLNDLAAVAYGQRITGAEIVRPNSAEPLRFRRIETNNKFMPSVES